MSENCSINGAIAPPEVQVKTTEFKTVRIKLIALIGKTKFPVCAPEAWNSINERKKY